LRPGPAPVPTVSWLPVFERIADEVAIAVQNVWGKPSARRNLGRGAGGDTTVMIDRVAEDAALAVLADVHAAGRDFTLLSEELGEHRFGNGGDIILLDPIDGSHNAKMGLPYFSIALAVARGMTYGDVFEGTVRNLATGDHYAATRGMGATLNGLPLRSTMPGEGAGSKIDVVQIAPVPPVENLSRCRGILALALKVRIMGSAALNICMCASGAVSLSADLNLRSVDCAGALLILTEAGGASAGIDGVALDDVTLDLNQRVAVLSAQDAANLGRALEALRPQEVD